MGAGKARAAGRAELGLHARFGGTNYSVSRPEKHQRSNHINHMKKTLLKIGVFSLLAVAITFAPTQGFADEKKTPAAPDKKEAPAGEKKQGRIPFHGKLDAVDKTAKTITLGERKFQITSETKLMKNGKPATLGDAVVGEEVGGNYQKGEDGKLNAKMVRFGPKPGAEVKGEAKKVEGQKQAK